MKFRENRVRRGRSPPCGPLWIRELVQRDREPHFMKAQPLEPRARRGPRPSPPPVPAARPRHPHVGMGHVGADLSGAVGAADPGA